MCVATRVCQQVIVCFGVVTLSHTMDKMIIGICIWASVLVFQDRAATYDWYIELAVEHLFVFVQGCWLDVVGPCFSSAFNYVHSIQWLYCGSV